MADTFSRSAKDTYVDEGRPDKNFSGASTFTVRDGGGATSQMLGLLRLTVPVPAGATVIAAVLVLTQGAAVASARTVRLKRLTEDTNFGNVDWVHKPTHSDVGEIVAAKDSAGANVTNGQWWFDITAYVQDVVNGGQNLGWKIACDQTNGLNFASSEHPNIYLQPVLVVVYSTAPSAPTKLKPSASYVSTGKPTVSCDYTDRSGSTQLQSIRVQIDPGGDFAGGDLWDSGEEPVNQPALDLATTDYPGITVGAATWWRVMVKDADNNWSGWSEPTWFGNAAQGVLTITYPAEGVDPPPDPGEGTWPPEFPSGIPGHGGGHG